MSTEQPGKSSTREGLRLNTGLSVREDVRDPRPGMSFFLGPEMEGRKVRLDESSPLRVLEEGEKPSVFQYIRCIRWPWLVSLKWYWHDPWLVVHIENKEEVRQIVNNRFSKSFNTMSKL